MQVNQAYEKYQILPALQLHMYRVAAVAALICQNFPEKLQVDNIISACLLHDMGNIIKFKLGFLPDLLEPHGIDYWRKIQNEFMRKYGIEEHLATYKIADELGVSLRTLELIKSVGFSQADENAASTDYAKKICCYADQRVTPTGIASLQDRIMEGRQRHAINKSKPIEMQEFDRLAAYLVEIEAQIFTISSIYPDEVSGLLVDPLVQQLENFELV